MASEGRVFRHELVVPTRAGSGGVELLAPMPGLWRGAPRPGTVVQAGDALGALDVLGVLHELRVPDGIRGRVAGDAMPPGERVVAHGDVLAELVELAAADGPTTAGVAAAKAEDGARLLFRSPLSGRYYARPSPDKPSFVAPGDELTVGQTVALLEVMKTFNRLAYGGAGLPERARVKAVLVRDEDDVQAGTPILELEPV
jgi:acetyl-CoA carboxylase biotin carboxyl carrier protein